MELGKYGVWVSPRTVADDQLGEAAKLVEQLGFGTFWRGGSPQLPALRPILAATDRLVAATGILNVWNSDPVRVAADFAELEAEFPGRVLLGIGIGHPEATREYTKPLSAMRAFLDVLDDAASPVPPDRRCLAALRPRMVRLSSERALGAHPYFVPAAHTRWAREQLGEAPLLAPEVACVIDPDAESGRSAARDYARLYLALTNYTSNLLAHGFTDEDIANGGSDRLIDAVIPHGTADQVASAVREHVDAGADHVCVQPVGLSETPREQWTALAGALGLG
ncbi:MAG TPA: TIGR03620 family F420-dependent LLM class oxidoreductase [Solirubrobacteraceae bacterium]|jgi:probable F420-dependent oxidoreductase|nr:TIGR03620 family F420-dependent LLM class oxidoreductase [Solirubrobacteraceae bacterium]